MRVGLFIGSFAGGGAERMMVNLAKGLSKKEIEVTIYVVNKKGPFLKEVPSNIKIYSFEAKSGVKSVLHKIRRTLRKDGLTAFISTQMHINAAVGVASIGLKNKPNIIFREANTPSEIVNSAFSRFVYKWTYKLADHFVAVSQGVKHDMVTYFNLDEEKVSVIYNPVIDDMIFEKMDEAVAHPWFNDSEIPVIVGMGRFAPQKAFEDLIDAFTLVRKKRKSRLVIFGKKDESSPYFKMIQNKIEKSGFAEDILLPGFVDNPFKYLRKTSVFVLASKFEGLPGVLIQALACGCPVVSTDCPSGPREILEDEKYGILVKVGDYNKLSEAIITTLETSQPEDDLIERARLFSVYSASEKYIKLIRD